MSASTTMPAAAPAIRPRSRWPRACANSCRAPARLKTGTPPRIDGRSIDYSPPRRAAGRRAAAGVLLPRPPQRSPARRCICHITAHQRAHARHHPRGHRPLADVHRRDRGRRPALLPLGRRQGACASPTATRTRSSSSPRACDTHEVYPNGISTSLPFDVQQASSCARSRGSSSAHITRPGYAIEYDYLRSARPQGARWKRSAVAGLFFAGQINGTTGYEEAAAQGLLAGINAAQRWRGAEPWTPKRSEAYLGVLVDDLVTQRHARALSHVHQPRRVPPAAARGQRRCAPDAAAAASWGWSMTSAGLSSRRSAAPCARNSRACRRCG